MAATTAATTPPRRTVLVSGATGAVGSAAAARLLQVLGDGDRVILLGRNATRLDDTATALISSKPDPTPGATTGDPIVDTAVLTLTTTPDTNDNDTAHTASHLATQLATALGTPEDTATSTVLINAVGPSSTVTGPLATAALHLGMHVVDPGGSERLITELDDLAHHTQRTVLLGAGVQPGLTGAMLTAALRLVTDPTRATAEIAVGGRQPLTAATLREYMDSLSADGGWPGAIWHEGTIIKNAGSPLGDSYAPAGWNTPDTASLSVHLDEEYVDLARAHDIASLRGINVMDAPHTVRELHRVIAGEATIDDVAAASEHETTTDTDRYFRIAVRIDSHIPTPPTTPQTPPTTPQTPPTSTETITANYRCTDSYRVTGDLAVDAALTLLAGNEPTGARWAYTSKAAHQWTTSNNNTIGVTITYDLTTDPTDTPPRGAIVIGAGFGARYAHALTQPGSPAPLTALVGTGGHTGRQLARDLGVRYLTTTSPTDTTDLPHIPEFPTNTAAAIVAVRSGMIGGQGDDLAASLLRAGIPVLQELPVDPETVTTLTSLARTHGTTYRVTGFYEHLGPGRAFINAVHSLARRSTITHVLLRTSHQVLDRAAILLAEALGAVPLGDVRILPGAGPGRWFISGMWGRVPVDVVVDHRMDPRDPDNHAQPVASAVVETADGELTWDGVGSLPRWSQRPHVVDGALTDPDGAVSQTWGHSITPSDLPSTWGAVAETAWPEGIHRAVAGLIAEATGTDTTTTTTRHHQRTQLVLRWWLRVSSALPAPVDIQSTPPVRMNPPGEGTPS